MDRLQDLKTNLDAIADRMNHATVSAGRAQDSVQLLAVSKTKPVSDIAGLHELGLSQFGENYVQEAVDKIEALRHLPITWHYIGHIQSNKTQIIAQHFDWVHTLDRAKIASRLNESRTGPPLNVLIQVNVDHAPTKSGVLPADLDDLVSHVTQCPQLRLRGLMSIPDPENADALRRAHQDLKALFDGLRDSGRVVSDFDTLSMGMTNDLELAIANGSTMVRIGTALFGARTPKDSA